MPLRVGLVGAGHMGRIHAQKLAGMKGVHLACVVDADLSAAAETARRYGSVEADHYGRALEEGIQAAVVAAPTESHYAVARPLLERGVHVFIEKPIAASIAEARELIDVARKKKLVLQVGHLERFSPPFRRAQSAVRDPLLIEARRISPFTGRSTDIDVVHDVMIHDIDLVLSLVKRDIVRTDASGARVVTEKIDVAHARIEFVGGCIANLAASRVSQTRERVFTIIEKDAYFSCDLAACCMYSSQKNGNDVSQPRTYKAAHPDPVHDELKAFIKAVKQGTDALVSGEDGLAALLLANDIQEKIEQHLALNASKDS